MILNKLVFGDPANNNKKSVSFTLIAYSLVLLVVCGICKVTGLIADVDPFDKLFYSCLGLYFGRNLSVSKDKIDYTKTDGQ